MIDIGADAPPAASAATGRPPRVVRWKGDSTSAPELEMWPLRYLSLDSIREGTDQGSPSLGGSIACRPTPLPQGARAPIMRAPALYGQGLDVSQSMEGPDAIIVRFSPAT